MPIVRTLKTNFASGQLDALMAGRSDTSYYQNGSETLLNNAPLIEGGAERRGGFRFLNDLTSAITNDHKLEIFQFNDDQRYLFFFENTKVTIYNSDGSLAQTITSTLWTSAMLPGLDITQEADTMFVFHEDMAPQVIKRTGVATFTVSTFAFETNLEGNELRQPYHRFAADSIYLTPSAGTGSITLTSSATFFTAAMVGYVFRLVYDVEDDVNDEIEELFYEIEITAYASGTSVTGTLRRDLPTWANLVGTAGTYAEDHRRRYEDMPWWTTTPAAGAFIPTDRWQEPVFSTTRGWPRSGTFHSQRLCFGGSASLPSWIWTSKIGAFYNFEPGKGLDNDALSGPCDSGVGHKIKHLVSMDRLIAFTDRGAFYQPQGDTKPLTPENFGMVKTTPYGISDAEPQIFDDAVIYVQDGDEVVREFRWNDADDKYLSPAISVVANSLLNSIADMCAVYSNDDGRPEQFVYFVNGDGSITAFHGSRAQEIAAWFPWETNGLVKSVAGFGDDLFILVQRTINSVTKRYLEKFDRTLTLDAAETGATITASVTHAGFAHLASQEVAVNSGKSDFYHGIFTVSAGGVITLEEPDTTITAGLNYTRTIKDLPVDVVLPDGPSFGLMKRTVEVIVQCNDSLEVAFEGQNVALYNVTDDLSVDPSAKTGYYRFKKLGWNRHGQVTLEQATPLKMTILSLVKTVST